MKHTEIEINRQLETEAPKHKPLHPEQQAVIDLLEQYPATEFRLGWFTHTGDGTDPVLYHDSRGRAVCFTCVAGWTCRYMARGTGQGGQVRRKYDSLCLCNH